MNRVNEPIQVCDKQYNYFPKTFHWRGRLHHVRAVERCWSVNQRRWRGAVERHCFRVRTVNAVYDLYQDLSQDQWYLDSIVMEGSEVVG